MALKSGISLIHWDRNLRRPATCPGRIAGYPWSVSIRRKSSDEQRNVSWGCPITGARGFARIPSTHPGDSTKIKKAWLPLEDPGWELTEYPSINLENTRRSRFPSPLTISRAIFLLGFHTSKDFLRLY